MGAGNLVVLAAASNGGALAAGITVNDSATNSYALIATYLEFGSNNYVYIYACLSGKAFAGTGGSGNLVTLVGAAGYVSMWAVEVTGASSWTTGPTAAIGATSATCTCGPILIAAQPAFAIFSLFSFSSNISGVGPGFTFLTGAPPSGNQTAAGYAIVTTNGNLTAAPTQSASTGYDEVLAAFYGAQASGDAFFFGSD